MSSPDFDLVVIGDCNPDVLVLGSDVTPVFGQAEKLVDRMSLEIGGSASITAVAAARLGLRVALVAAVGRDAAGTLTRAAALGCASGALSTGALGGTAGAPDLQKAADLAEYAVIALGVAPSARREPVMVVGCRPRRGEFTLADGI